MPRSSVSDALVHLGRDRVGDGRPVNLPISQGSTMLFDTLAAFEDARQQRYAHGTLYYGRYGNPASIELERAMTVLESGAGCISVSSGLTAVTMALMGVASAGSHLLVADNVYGPTRSFCDTVLTRCGIEVGYFDPMAPLDGQFRDTTVAVMFEAPGSGTFEVPDIPEIARSARNAGAISIIDATWATPVFCKPLTLGVDVVVHSGSKYIGGHSDSMIGFIVCNAQTFDSMRKSCLAFGDRAGGQDVFLSLRGLRTLEMRMRMAEQAGLTVARWLLDQPQVMRLLHPAFESCPGHAFWKRDFTGSAGLFSAVIKPCDTESLHAFVDALQLFGVGVSWGGYESLVLPVEPHRTAKPWTDKGRVIRFSIGFEDTDSLIADLSQALPHLN